MVSCVVKLGGAAITHKAQLETVNAQILQLSASQLQESSNCGKNYAVVHGAGGFGHQIASEGSVAQGFGSSGSGRAAVRCALVRTRQSVLKLNHLVVSALTEAGLPAVSLSPFGSWKTKERKVIEDGCDGVVDALNCGLIPVLHGDCVVDVKRGVTILGGDPIVARLAQKLRPEFVLFLTNVDGIFSGPPEESQAKLIPRIFVKSSDGSWHADGCGDVRMSTATVDVTGGIAAKVEEAAAIAMDGIPVVICKAGTASALTAMQRGVLCASEPGWRGTIVQQEPPR